jgi:hypothetical protein
MSAYDVIDVGIHCPKLEIAYVMTGQVLECYEQRATKAFGIGNNEQDTRTR